MEWISVEDRLPGLYDWVLVSITFYKEIKPYITTAYRNKIDQNSNDWHWWWFGYPSKSISPEEVTHWMSLPEPPESKEE